MPWASLLDLPSPDLPSLLFGIKLPQLSRNPLRGDGLPRSLMARSIRSSVPLSMVRKSPPRRALELWISSRQLGNASKYHQQVLTDGQQSSSMVIHSLPFSTLLRPRTTASVWSWRLRYADPPQRHLSKSSTDNHSNIWVRMSSDVLPWTVRIASDLLLSTPSDVFVQVPRVLFEAARLRILATPFRSPSAPPPLVVS